MSQDIPIRARENGYILLILIRFFRKDAPIFTDRVCPLYGVRSWKDDTILNQRGAGFDVIEAQKVPLYWIMRIIVGLRIRRVSEGLLTKSLVYGSPTHGKLATRPFTVFRCYKFCSMPCLIFLSFRESSVVANIKISS